MIVHGGSQDKRANFEDNSETPASGQLRIVFFRILLQICFVLLGSGTLTLAVAEDWASVVITPGNGRIEIVSDYIIFSSGSFHKAKIPALIEAGTRINIAYEKDNKWIHIEFDVAGISTKDDLCRIHNKMPANYSSSPGNTIYVRPCGYK